MSHHAGVWIDHTRAVIVASAEEGLAARTVKSEVEPHPRFSAQPDGGGGEKRYEERHGQRLDQYYDEVVGQLGRPEALLIFGPGEAKLELKERIRRSKALSDCTIDVEAADKLTDPQVVARVKEHFRIDR